MAPEQVAAPSDATRGAWRDALRPSAERTLSKLWRDHHRLAVLNTAPRRLNKKGRVAPGAGLETNESRLRKFDDLRGRVCAGLSSGALSADAARQRVARSEFAGVIRVATTRDEAVQHLAELFVVGDNAWCDGEGGAGVLWIDCWRE